MTLPKHLILLSLLSGSLANASADSAGRRFDFLPGGDSPTNVYSSAAGFGFEPGATITSLPDGGVTADKPFYFSIALPEGNHRVTVTFGNKSGTSANTVKAEARRLMLENVTTAKGETVTRSFTVNTRTVGYPGGKVHLKGNELTNETVTWDDKLTIEFNGGHAVVRSLEFAPDTNVATIFIAGDSTVCDQPREPWNSWGQMLPRFFNAQVAVANYARSGESIKSSLGAHRFEKIFSVIRPGDFLLLQFGHNDMKDKATNALAIYQTNLKKLVAAARAKGATPVLVTSMERKAGVNSNTLGRYPDTVRAVAAEDGVPLVDLNVMSLKFYRALGADLDRAFQDGTHHNNYGSYELARCVVEGVRAAVPALARFIASDAAQFNPEHPDSPKTFVMPSSLLRDITKPEGN